MLQFEFDIREYKIKNNQSKGIQLALGISFFITAVLFFIYQRYLDMIPFSNYFHLILAVIACYFIGLLIGFKILYPKEYLIINSRKLKYKTGWKRKEIKIYLKDIHEFQIGHKQLVLTLEKKEVVKLDIRYLSDHAIEVLKNYLNLVETKTEATL